MKKYITSFLILYSFIAYSQQKNTEKPVFISKDSLFYDFDENWKFMEGDDSAMSGFNYDDSKWLSLKSTLYFSEKSSPPFKGMGWFRYHFIADTSITGRPLAMEISHFGASEIYLDGKLIESFGRIAGPDSSEYFDPLKLPFVFMIPGPGEHVLAVRYANYLAQKNYNRHLYQIGGFRATIGRPDQMIENIHNNSVALTFILISLVGIFLTLSLLHLFMYLYNRSIKSNLSFSIFMFCLSGLFFIGFITLFFHGSKFVMDVRYLTAPFFFALPACHLPVLFINCSYKREEYGS